MDAFRQLTAAELVLLRTHPQRTDLYLAIPTYATVYTAVVVAPVPASNDGVYRVTFNGGAGVTWANVVSGMTLSVGTVAGGSNVGFARIRAAAWPSNAGITTADAGVTGIIYIGTTSEIDFAAGQFLTVTNEFGLWPRHPYVDPATGEEFMDWNIDYTNQHSVFAPVPCMMPHAVVELIGGTAMIEFSGRDEWSPDPMDSSRTYAWACSPVATSSIDNPAAQTVNITFTVAGTYLVSVETAFYYLADTVHASSFGYRYVIVYDAANPLIKSPVLESCSGDYENGGWSYRVTCHSQADLATIHNRTLCMLVAKDWYGATQQSVGPILHRENIVCIGWIDGESIKLSNDTGDVSFDVQGPQWWLDRTQGYPTGVDYGYSFTPDDWTNIDDLNVRYGLWHFLHWRTTATAVIDIPAVAQAGWLLPDNRLLATTYTPAGSLLEQLRAMADRMFARVVCDRYSRMFINADMQLVDDTDRPPSPNVMGADGVSGFTDADWRDEIMIERRTVSEAALVDLSGIYWSGTVATSSALFSLAPGHYFKHYGRPASRDRIALTNQAEANLLAGLYLGWLNNEYPTVDIPLAANNRAFDIAPYMFSWMTIAAGDTPRGIEWTNKRLIPRRVSFERDAGDAVMLADVTFEAETFAYTAMTGDPPIAPPEPDPTDPPEPPCVCDDPTAMNFGGACPCVPFPTYAIVIAMDNAHLGISFDFYTAPVPTWDDLAANTPALVSAIAAGAQFINVTLSDTGECWIITDGDRDANGLWYCASVLSATPIFALLYSHNACGVAFYGGAANATFGALGSSTAGIAYTTASISGYLYGKTTLTAVPVAYLPCDYGQFHVSSGLFGSSPRQALGKGGTPMNGIWDMAANALVFNWPNAQPAPEHIDIGFFIWGNILYSYADGDVAGVNIVNGVATFLAVDGANAVTVRIADGNLMIGAVSLCSALAAFGAARVFGGCCIGLAGYGELCVCANDAHATNFFAMRDTGGTWMVKDGDWVAKLGAWSGAGHAQPMIVTRMS